MADEILLIILLDQQAHLFKDVSVTEAIEDSEKTVKYA